jgi:hypothetical protein
MVNPMKLTHEQRERLAEQGLWRDESCDRCGGLLGSIRYTRRGEPGAWCSELCRDGAEVVAARKERKGGKPNSTGPAASVQSRRIGSRKSGRPKVYATNAQKQRAYRGRPKNGLALRNTPAQAIENAQLADAENGSHVVSGVPAAEGLKPPSTAGKPMCPLVQLAPGMAPRRTPPLAFRMARAPVSPGKDGVEWIQ